jgi:3-oxoacyl-[acyl-carrier protein] reductase
VDLLLNDKAALVTGGGRGIGQAIAVALAQQGVHVAVCGRTRVPLEATAALVETHGVKSAVIVADLLDPDGCRRAVEETASSFGRLDILISNASTNVDGHPPDLEGVTDGQLMERVNGKGMASVRVTRAALPHLRASGQGRVILLGGTSARVVAGPGGGFASGLGNAFVANFAKRLSADVAPDGITVNVIHPGVTKTDRHPPRIEALAARLGVSYGEAEAARDAEVPIGRMVEAGDVAAVAVFFASPLCGAVTGQTIAVDGGATPCVVY